MKILRVADIPILPTGGMGKVFIETSCWLRKMGHEVFLMGSDQLGCNGSQNFFFRNYIKPFVVRKKISQFLAENPTVDLVEIHEPLSFGMIFPRRLHNSQNKIVPMVVMSHGVEERGRLSMLDIAPPSLPQRLHRWFRDFLVRRSFISADAVMCLNQTDLAFLNRLGVKKAHVIFNGVDIVSGKGSSGGDQNNKNLCFLGSWIERKGSRILINAYSAIRNKFPEAKLKVVGAGKSDPEIRKEFSVKDIDGLDIVPFFDDGIKDLLDGYDFFILPSYFEGFPLSMLEAAALSKIIIASDNSGMRDFIRDGQNGFLFKTGDVNDLVSKINFCFNNPKEMGQIGQNARYSASLYSWANAAESIQIVFTKVLEVAKKKNN